MPGLFSDLAGQHGLILCLLTTKPSLNLPALAYAD